MNFEIRPYGEKALIVQFKNEISLSVHQRVKELYTFYLQAGLKGVRSLIPAYNSLTFLFNKEEIDFLTLKLFIENTPVPKLKVAEERIVEIPVCYDKSLGLDLLEVEKNTGLSYDEMIDKHSSVHYTVYMLGFSPGFMYLGGLDKKLHIPRKKTPRLKIPAGAVGLADQQTGIYPQATPGGWQIIGQTPIEIFSIQGEPLVKMGDKVRFIPIDLETFHKIKKDGI